MDKSVVRVIWNPVIRTEAGGQGRAGIKMLLPRVDTHPGEQCSPPTDFILLTLIFWGCMLCKLREPSESFGSKPERGLPWRRFSFLSWDASDLPSRVQRPATFHKALQLDPAHPVLISSTTCCGAEGTTVCLWDAWEGCRRHKSNLSSAGGTRRTGWILHPSLRYSLPW